MLSTVSSHPSTSGEGGKVKDNPPAARESIPPDPPPVPDRAPLLEEPVLASSSESAASRDAEPPHAESATVNTTKPIVALAGRITDPS